MMRTVFLHGALGDEFGESFRFEIDTAAEAVRALNCAFPGKFLKALEGGTYRVIRGKPDAGMELDLELVTQLRLGAGDLHFIPMAEGAISQTAKGTTKLVLGSALVGAAIFASGGTLAAPLTSTGLLSGMTWGNIALVGVGLTLAGVSTLLTKASEQTGGSNDVSVAGAAQGETGQQGAAISLIYGEVLTPGITISVASQIEDISVYASSAGSIEDAFGTNPAYWSGEA
ncbi:putative phage tail protein [Bradyrhizobium sp. LB7.2]